MEKIFIWILLLNSILTAEYVRKCDGEIIEHCIKCNEGENSDSCETCEDKFFPFFNNLLCLPCNDSTYGQIGCQGNCNGSNYVETRFAFCEEGGCKEGYYNLNGICMKCSEGSDHCINCTYEVQEESTNGNFICHKCENNTYRLTEYGTCEKCYISYCDICHYDNNTQAVCDKCSNGYYINQYRYCQNCNNVSIFGGNCSICSDNNTAYETGECWCYAGYTLVNHSKCVECPNGCSRCLYNNQTKKTECQNCYSGYVMTPDKNCKYCGDGCESCTIDKKGHTNCTSCYSGTFLNYNECLICSDGCDKCEIDKSSPYKNESKCTQCYYYYALSPYNNCTYCRDILEIGGYGCYKCEYNKKGKKYQCLSCRNDNYTHITNDFKCLSNIEPKQIYLYGCLRAISIGNGKYECQECKYDFIQIVNDKTCRRYNEISISTNCLVVENLKTPEDPLYSCRECLKYYAHIIINSKGQKNCYARSGNFSYCLEGEIEDNGNKKCTRCVEHAIINSSGICECNFDSFGKYNEWCYRCDDKETGNPGCQATKGCNYTYSNNELDCNGCKEGYFEYTRGQCFNCLFEINNCEKCHFDKELKCDKCVNIFSPNKEKDKCEINECQEYPEITPGCIICKDNLNEYKSKKKCQSCKYGYFKTKNETCVYCRAEKYGGSGCYECGYEEDENGKETDNIICKFCNTLEQFYNEYYYFSDYYKYISVLTSNKKCYLCNDDLSIKCIKCEIIKNSENKNKLKCTVCLPGYYLDSEGNCISFLDKIEKIPNCHEYTFNIANLSFYYYDYNYYYDYYYYYEYNNQIFFNYYNDEKSYYDNFSFYNEIFIKMNYPIKTKCEYCNNKYFLNDDGKCEILNLEKCVGSFIIRNISNRLRQCENFCYQNNFLLIYLGISNNSIIFEPDINNMTNIKYIYNILYDYDFLNEESKKIILDMPICLNISSDENIGIQFEGCNRVIYIPNNKSYVCFECNYDYKLDSKTHKCQKFYENYEENIDCIFTNIGTDLAPIYTCKECYDSMEISVTFENGIQSCIYDNILENCIKVYANSSFLNPIYNCTSCKINYLPYYSKYYERIICQNVYEKITKYKNISLLKFEGEEYSTVEETGFCRKNYFTPDGKKCYKCDNKNVGMPGCKGECNFSLYRNNTILCESECKDEYIESSPGICETCNNINQGCYKCHYEYSYPSNYFGIKRARRFQCDLCKDGYIISENGKCLTCYDLGFKNCEKCGKDEITGNYICNECSKYYFLDELGDCNRCIVTRAIINNKCIECADVEKGGINGCYFCINDKNTEILCKQCYEGFILFTDNNTCIKRESNKILSQFENCHEIKTENGKLVCSRCKHELTLLKTANETKCIYAPTLYDPFYYRYYYNHYYYDIFKRNSKDYTNYRNNDYNFRQNYFFPCKKSINLGNNENPLYSCSKCYNIFENEDYELYSLDYNYYYYYGYYDYYYGNLPIKIIDNTVYNISYCMLSRNEAENCTEAIYKLAKGNEIYNCTKCIKDNILLYNKELDINYCAFNQESITKCLVDYCKTCISNNNYFCSNCMTSDYEVNQFTGACVKKTLIIPAITWKDIYRLEMNGQKEINGQIISGPTLNLRGITSSQINTRHAFLIYLTFKIKHGLRNLQETIKIPAICEIKEGVEETNDYVNIVDYECIGNSTVDEKYELSGIEEFENNNNIISGNLKEINKIINETEDLANKNNSVFTYEIIKNMIFFYINTNNINTINSSNNNFDFCLNGTINKQLSNSNKITSTLRNLNSDCINNINIGMNKINDKAECAFCSDKNLNASLSCILTIKDNIDSTNISFGVSEINIEETNQTIYIPELNKIHLNYIKPEKLKKSNKALKIALMVIISVIILGGLLGFMLYCIKLERDKNSNLIKNNNIKDEKMNHHIKSEANLDINEKN